MVLEQNSKQDFQIICDDKWIGKRKATTIAFSVQSVILGIEYTLTFLTLWLYIKEMINTNSPKFYYALVSISYLLSSTLFTPIIGRIVDKTRHVRLTFLICNLCLVIGNLLYSFHFSPWFLVAGRFISGCAGLRSVMCGEIVRSYPSDETSYNLALLSVTYNAGFILGPGVNFLFTYIDFHIGLWHLNTYNFNGLFMAFLSAIMLFLSVTMVHDLSKEFDLKAHEEKNSQKLHLQKAIIQSNNSSDSFNETVPLVDYMKQDKHMNGRSSSSYINIFKLLKLLFTSIDAALLLFCTFFVMLFLVTFDMWLPILIIDTLHLSILELNICVFGTGATSVAILFLYMWKPVSENKLFVAVVMGLFGLCLVDASFIFLKHANIKLLNILLGVLYMICFAGAGIIPDVYLTDTLAKLVNSNVQTFVDGIRNSMYSAGCLLALASAAYTFEYVEIFSAIYIVLTLLCVYFLIVRKKHLLKPKLIF
ncbi:uncharacterized protein LOC105850459 isoform X1 [Hydra vulgaris]|uniref:uncharacterized protein LOC105850459 isoform X1 n=1 Tax=Hydra vulgaris TaxID=6087 RepID=UPI001F5E4DA8|nr:uncharacterized protein LOC105850459 [Hydra vulgaris]